MTNLKLFDELYALNIPGISRFLARNANKLIHKCTIYEFAEKVGEISVKLPAPQQEKVELILAYTLKEQLEYEEEYGFEYCEDLDLIDNLDLFATKKNTHIESEKHIESKRENISYALKHVGEGLAQTPHDHTLIAKRSSLQKQNHILNKH